MSSRLGRGKGPRSPGGTPKKSMVRGDDNDFPSETVAPCEQTVNPVSHLALSSQILLLMFPFYRSFFFFRTLRARLLVGDIDIDALTCSLSETCIPTPSLAPKHCETFRCQSDLSKHSTK